MTTLVISILSVLGLLVIFLGYIKPSGDQSYFIKDWDDAQSQLEINFDFFFSDQKNDNRLYEPIVEIVKSDFFAIVGCFRPKTSYYNLKDEAKKKSKKINIPSSCSQLLVLNNAELHFIEFDFNNSVEREHIVFIRDKMMGLVVTQNERISKFNDFQSWTFKMEDTSKEGDRMNESRKLTFTYMDKYFEFILFETICFRKVNHKQVHSFNPKKSALI